MKRIKLKPLIISCIICLLPILLGVSLYDKLPDSMAVHFNFHNIPDNMAPKAFAVFAMPCLMALLQIFCCVVHDINAAKKGINKKFEIVIKSIVPFISVLVYAAIIAYSLGAALDMRKIAMFMVGFIFIAMGNYMPKFTSNAARAKSKKFLRIIGYESVILGLLFIITIFLPAEFSVGALILLIPCTVIFWIIERKA